MRHNQLSDEELVDLIAEALQGDDRVRSDYLDVDCHNRRPVISGRVRSDQELQLIDEILSNVLDIHDYENNVWVDDLLSFTETEEESQDEEKLGKDEDDGLNVEDDLDEDEEKDE